MLLPAGSKVRFRVTDEGRAGSSWSVQTSKTTGDVYVIHREGGRWIKASLHESGQWHFGVGQRDPRQSDEEDPPPSYMAVTREHEEIAPGWLRAMRISVARSELREGYVEEVSTTSVADVPVHPAYNGISIDVFLGDRDPSLIQLDQAYVVAHMARGDGGQVVVAAFPTTIVGSVHDVYAAQIDEVRDGLQTRGWDGSVPMRAVLFGNEPDGMLRQIEVAIDPS